MCRIEQKCTFFSIHYVNGTVQDKMKWFLPKCSEKIQDHRLSCIFYAVINYSASSYCWNVTGENLSTWAIFEGGGSLLSPIKGGRGRRPPTTVGWQKTRRIALSYSIKISPVGSLD